MRTTSVGGPGGCTRIDAASSPNEMASPTSHAAAIAGNPHLRLVGVADADAAAIAAAALDPTCELWLHELKGSGDLDGLEPVAHRYVSGIDEEAVMSGLETDPMQSVKLSLDENNTNQMIEQLKKADFQTVKKQEKDLGLSIVLGGCGVTLEEMTRLYSAFANGGELQNPTLTHTRNSPLSTGEGSGERGSPKCERPRSFPRGRPVPFRPDQSIIGRSWSMLFLASP